MSELPAGMRKIKKNDIVEIFLEDINNFRTKEVGAVKKIINRYSSIHRAVVMLRSGKIGTTNLYVKYEQQI